jgi:hypothetical protein
MSTKQGVMTAAAALVLMLSVGCGGRDLPELAPVEGKVTLDGKPVPNVMVQFLPENGGRPSTGTTDDEGHYELTYVAGEMGARLGRNKVEVVMIWPDGEPTPGVKDVVPAAYKGKDTTLSFEVKAEDNVFDIPMTSSGK